MKKKATKAEKEKRRKSTKDSEGVDIWRDSYSLKKEGFTLSACFPSLFENNPPGIVGFDRPGNEKNHPSVDVLGQQLQKLLGQLNQAKDTNQKSQIASRMQQILSQIATGGGAQQNQIKRGGI